VPLFQVPDEMARYKQLLFLASKLPKLPAEDHTDDNKVKGCVSQVLYTALCLCDGCVCIVRSGRP
jgi:BolA-like protein 1